MTFVLNRCYGGFGLSDFACSKLGIDPEYGDMDRNDELMINALASLISEFGSEACSDECAELTVVEIPDCSTDWEINEYDGYESIIYVVDGKICHL